MTLSNSAQHVLEASTASALSDNATVIEGPGRNSDDKRSPTGPPRTLILCFDGTGDQFDEDNSNIVEFFHLLKKDDMDKQVAYYQAGIGTYFFPQIATPLRAKVSKVLDEAIAWNLSAHVMDGYEFLMQYYTEGDRICIFGFSRGAYTARCLTGMIHKVGLLPAGNRQQVPFAYRMYEDISKTGERQAKRFKETFSMNVPIEFLGLWDSVSSVGQGGKTRGQPMERSYRIIRTFRHAVALDEHRVKFKPQLWNIAREHGSEKASSEGESRRAIDVKEVWFAGCHCDVGGGSVENDTLHTLARIPLRWMVRECIKADTGIIFRHEALCEIGLDPAALYPKVEKRPPAFPANSMQVQRLPAVGPKWRNWYSDPDARAEKEAEKGISEEEHELFDAMSPIYDQLKLSPAWWILEFLPIMQRYQQSDEKWAVGRHLHRGKGRSSQRMKKSFLVHRSVKMRMEANYTDGKKYFPKASFFKDAYENNKIIWVE